MAWHFHGGVQLVMDSLKSTVVRPISPKIPLIAERRLLHFGGWHAVDQIKRDWTLNVKPFIHLYIHNLLGKKMFHNSCMLYGFISVNWPITSTGLNFKHHVSRFWDDTVQWINQDPLILGGRLRLEFWTMSIIILFLPSLAALQPSLSCITIPTIVIIILLKSICWFAAIFVCIRFKTSIDIVNMM